MGAGTVSVVLGCGGVEVGGGGVVGVKCVELGVGWCWVGVRGGGGGG